MRAVFADSELAALREGRGLSMSGGRGLVASSAAGADLQAVLPSGAVLPAVAFARQRRCSGFASLLDGLFEAQDLAERGALALTFEDGSLLSFPEAAPTAIEAAFSGLLLTTSYQFSASEAEEEGE